MHTFQLRPYITACQCHAARSPFRADRLDLRICSYLDEALNEVFRQRRAFGIFFRSEVLEYVCELLPEVQGFLLHFHIVSMFLPITSLCPVLSCPVYIPATVLLLFPLLIFPPLLFLPLFLSPTAYIHLPSPSPSPKRKEKKATHLKLLMTIKQQNIHRLQLIHISMPLKFLSNLGSNFRHGHIERIHRLDFRCLLYHTHTYSDDQYSFLFSFFPCPYPSPYTPSLSLFFFSFFLSYFFLPASCCFKIKKNQTYRSQPIPITRQNSLFRITPCRGCWLQKATLSLVFALALAYIIIIPPLECGRIG